MKNSQKKFLIIIIILILVILIYNIVHIYAIFTSQAEGNGQLKNGVWNIYVNGTNITQGIETTFVIDKINLEGNTKVKDGKIAPGLTGNFLIQINPTDTNVSVKYELSLDNKALEDKSFLKIESVEEIKNGDELIRTGENTYTGVIPLEKIESGMNPEIKIVIKWDDDGTHDLEDTEMGKVPENKLQIPIILKVSQYLGENIIAYEE